MHEFDYIHDAVDTTTQTPPWPDHLFQTPIPELLNLIRPHTDKPDYNICRDLIDLIIDVMYDDLHDLYHNANDVDVPAYIDDYANRLKQIAAHIISLQKER